MLGQPSLVSTWTPMVHRSRHTLQCPLQVARVIQFSGPAPVSLFPPPRRGRARVGVKAGGVPRPCFSPPSCPSPARGEGVEGSGRRGENRELHGPARSFHGVAPHCLREYKHFGSRGITFIAYTRRRCGTHTARN